MVELMIIELSPQCIDNGLTLVKSGDTLIINGEAFNFSPLPEGATLPADAIGCKWIAGDVHRIDGVLHVTLRLPLSARADATDRFPAPIVDPPDGPVSLYRDPVSDPAYVSPEPDEDIHGD